MSTEGGGGAMRGGGRPCSQADLCVLTGPPASGKALEKELLGLHGPGWRVEYCRVTESRLMPSGNVSTVCDCNRPMATAHFDHGKKIIYIHPDGRPPYPILDALRGAIDAFDYYGV
jgi:hypothetical protein